MNLLLVQAMLVLGLLPSDQVPNVGIEALEAGTDSMALRMLAGLMPNEAADAPELFARALIELGFPALSRSAAAQVYAIAISRQIVSGQISLQEGANKISYASLHVNDPEFHDLDPFIYAASELKDRPGDQDFFNRAIIVEAESWAARRPLDHQNDQS